MNFTLTQDQHAIVEMARTFAENELAPHALDWDTQAYFPVETFRKAATLGFASIYISDKNQGCGLSRLEASLIFEQLSQGCVSSAAYLSIHNMASWMIDAFGDKEHHQKWLPDLITMKKLASYCLTEPSSGSDAASLKTRALKEGDSYILTGEKVFISGGGVSDIYIVMARTGEAGAKGISTFVVEKNTPGLSFGKPEKKMGWNSQPTTTVVFDNCRIPISHRLGKEGDGFKIAMKALDGGRLNIASCSLGGARACLDKALRYAQERTQFGKTLSTLQSVQFKLADMATSLEAAILMTRHAAVKLDANDPLATQHCAMAKRFTTDICFDICNQALQIHGGYGYMREYEIERFVRDLRVHQILEGTNEIMRVIIARKLLEGA